MAGRTRRDGQRRLTARPVLLWVGIACLPLLFGQACPLYAPPVIEPVDTNLDASAATSPTGNAVPVFSFTAPLQDVAAEVGDMVTISWVDDDPDNNASITLIVDPDEIYGNGNEIVVAPLVSEDPDSATGTDTYLLDTSSLATGSYRIVARVTDGVNPQLLVTAPGRLLLYGAGLLPGNVSPSILVTDPRIDLGVSQGDTVDTTFCGQDPDDDGGSPATLPDVIILVDLDDDPTNDLDLTDSDAETTLTSICQSGSFPVPVEVDGQPVAYVLSCLKDNDCTDPATGSLSATWRVDVGEIPPTVSGEPYRIRATMWDHVNIPVHSYAPGTVSITALGAGTIDLNNVGRTVSGSKFLGFDGGDRAGSASTDLGDVNGDGVDDFAIVSQYGSAHASVNTGTVHIVMGLGNNEKFGSEIPLNSVSTVYGGSLAYMPPALATNGITSIARMGDVTYDGRPDVLIGASYVEAFDVHHDDDPCDCDGTCYGDLLPNPLNTPNPKTENMTGFDYRETSGCSNDLDTSSTPPIVSGFAFMIASDNNGGSKDLNSGVIPMYHIGCDTHADGVHAAFGWKGTKFLGGWYDYFDASQTVTSYNISANSLFGTTVATMPPMHDTSLSISSRFGTTQIFSAPNGTEGRGRINLTPINNFLSMGPSTQARPYYAPVGGCPACGRVLWYPAYTDLVGAAIGDNLGYAKPAGDYNLDGSRDIACGAPGADRSSSTTGNLLNNAGVVYVIFGRPDFYYIEIDIGQRNPPRLEIHGTRDDDRFGTMQTIVGDVNQDGLPDIGFSSGYADGPGGVDSGFIGIVFGGRKLTGENIFTVDQVATAQLPGVKIYGIQPGGHAGTVLNNAGDFNGDGTDDLLIVSPDEHRVVNGIDRRGVAYLIFGGTHMMGNPSFNLSQVGTTALPGIVFVSPYTAGSADEAPIDWASAAGDVNSDGFDDVLIGVSEADYVNPLEPSQRRNDSGEIYLIYGNNTGGNVVQQ